MPLLPYCIVEEAIELSPPRAGVAGAAVEQITASGLRAYYSSLAALARERGALEADALRFHDVVQTLFERTAVIPFRFPTLLSAEPELRSHLETHGAHYREFLESTRELVQMEIRIAPAPFRDNAKRATSARAGLIGQASGRQYLQARQAVERALQQHASSAGAAVKGMIRQWKLRRTRDGLRCYALVPRAGVPDFRQQAAALPATEDVTMVISGPWPATAFLDERS